MITDVLLRLYLINVEPSRYTLPLPEWAPAPLIEGCFSELVESASSLGQIYDAADTTNRVFRSFPVRIQAVEILTRYGLPLHEFRWRNPMTQLVSPPIDESYRREKNWESDDLLEFERVASFFVSFPEKPLPAPKKPACSVGAERAKARE